MAYNILLTSLFASSNDETIHYYKVKEGHKNYYCDAMLTVEASVKYVLAEYPIDEIITLGRKLTFDEGDDDRLIQLASGKDFYTSKISDLSTYSLFRYRIAQYIDELRIELQDIQESLSEEEQEKAVSFIRKYYRQGAPEGKHRRFNRMFEELAQSPGAFAQLCRAMAEEIPEAMADPARFREWTKNYLYSEMKDSAKLELLRENEEVAVRFIPTSLSEDGRMPIDNMTQLVHSVITGHSEEVHLYVALNNDDLTDNFVLLNVLDMIRMMPDSGVRLVNIMTTSSDQGDLTGEISSKADIFGISELVAGTKTFLQYGKVDMIVDFWERCGLHNERIESMIYAMRRIDIGISLCHIREIEDGIEDLRRLFAAGTDMGGDDYFSRIFAVMAEAIRRDYGPLVSKDSIDFIDLVKWAADKKFYQQTLTLIESRAPKAFVRHGIFYPCADEAEKDYVVRLFAEQRNELRPFELYMMDDMDHYFIKLYGRRMAPRDRGDRQKIYAGYRMGHLDNEDPQIITAYTASDDRQTLKDLLYAYYHVADVRNTTSHARDDIPGEQRLIVDSRDLPARMASITEAIDFFIMNYDKIIAEIESKGKEPTIIPISSFDVKVQAKRIQDDRKEKE